MPDDPETRGLLAMMLLHDSRCEARFSDSELVLLGDQDRSRWDTRQIAEGRAELDRALALGGRGPYVLQAAIASLHAEAPCDWAQIAALYGELGRLTGSPVVELNRAIAVAEVEGPEAGLRIVDGLGLDDFRYLHSTRAELLRRLGRTDEARERIPAGQEPHRRRGRTTLPRTPTDGAGRRGGLGAVRVAMATSPGHPGRSNEDFVAASTDVVLLVDGAGIPRTESICRHGVAWYAHTLGAALLVGLTRVETDPVGALADAIDQVAAQHRHTCDIANPSSPQATVAMVRAGADRVDYLVLADVFVVLDPIEAAPVVVTDPREVGVRDACSALLQGLPVGTPEIDRVRSGVVEALRARRNQPGGYWVAKDDPHAATEAVTGTAQLHDLNGVALLSNGASRIVDRTASPTGPPLSPSYARKDPPRSCGGSARARGRALYPASRSPTMRQWPTPTSGTTHGG